MITSQPLLKKGLLFFYALIFGYAQSIFAQTTVTISSGTNWTDALLYSKSGNTNYATYSHFAATAWTNGGADFKRTLVRFNLSSLPAGVTIQSAKLYLYSDPTVTSSSAWNGNSQLSGSNAVYFEKVISNWSETAVTWNNQPATTTTGRIWYPASTSTTENIQVDITSFVQGWVNSPTTNYGLKMRLENEAYYRSRTYASENHSNTVIRPKLVITYITPETDPIKNQMDHIFGSLNQTYIQTGILTDYGIDLADQSLFDGIIRDENVMNMNSWRTLYGSLLSSVINPSSNLVHLKTINQNLQNYWITYDKDNPVVDVSVLFAAYQTFRTDAIGQNLISESNGRLYDVPGRTASPYTTNFTFAAAPYLEFDEDGQVTFIFRSSLFVNSSNKTFSNLQVDFGDGAGYQTVTFNTQKHIIYSSAGSKKLKFRMQFTDGSVYYSHADFSILSTSSAVSNLRYTGFDAREYTFPRASDLVCPEAAFPDPEGFYGATVTVEYGDLGARPALECNPQFIRPLIVVEGYDASNFSELGIPNWSYDNFVDGRFNGAIFVDSDPGTAILSFSDRLEAAGYDLIFVDLDEGTGDIIQNALLVENIIRWINAHKINNPEGNREENVVLGQSMGGLIARYAICDMEKRRLNNPANNPDHEVRLLVTHDSPHRGVNVPLGFQAMAHELASMKLTKIGLVTYGSTGAIVGSFLELKDIVPALKQGEEMLNAPASQQMLIVQDGRSNTFLNGAYRTMVTFPTGYSPSFDMRAISNGSECGIGQNLLQPGGEIFFADANLYANRLLFKFSSGLVPPIGGFGSIIRAALHALTPFTGKNWKTQYVVRAAPSVGTNQAFYGKFGFEKKILFLLPVNITLFEKSRNSIAGALPWDSAPGGYYDLRIVQGSIPDNPNIDAYPIIDVNLTVRLAQAFNFVPTVSALDIEGTSISREALNSPYTDGFNYAYPSRFPNFIAQERDPTEVLGSINNSRHIQFTADNALWLFNEMQSVTPNNRNCSNDCEPVGISVIGSSTICGQETYTINHLPPGYSISWTRSTNLNYVPGQNTTSYTVIPNSGGTYWVEARLLGACGTLVYRKEISAVIPMDQLEIVGPTTVCPNEYYWFDVHNYSGIPILNYSWGLPFGWTVEQEYDVNSSWRETEIRTGSSTGSKQIMLTITTACGTMSYPYAVQVVSCLSPYTYTVSPNPSTDNITVRSTKEMPESVSGKTATKGVDETPPLVILKLYKVDNGHLAKSYKMEGKEFIMDTRTLERGNYILHIIEGNEIVEMQQLILE
jgi:pimeloyl-ACP methyl ester carboxylesterase